MTSSIGYRLRRRQRLRRSGEFSLVLKQGVFAVDRTLVVHGVANRLGWSRLGVTIPRRVGNAVTRNRWKRWIREAFRLSQHDIPQGIDFVVRPRKGACGDARQVRRSLLALTCAVARRLETQSAGEKS